MPVSIISSHPTVIMLVGGFMHVIFTEFNNGECVCVKNKSHSKYSKTRKIITLNTIIDVIVN